MKVWSLLLYWWWVYFGLLYRSFGNGFNSRGAYQRAVDCFSRALEHSPEEARLYFWRGTLLWRELSVHDRAEADLTRAIELNPKLIRAYLNRAFTRWYRFPPDRAGAAEDFSTYLAHSSDSYWRAVAEEHLQQLREGHKQS